MLEYNIKVTKRSANVLKEFHNYTYQQDKNGKWLNRPIDCYNHAIDATRYVIMNEVLGKNRKYIPDEQLLRDFF
jgi:phage terminase large subunit